MKNLAILGSTGSIGCNVLKIVEMFPQHFAVKALAAKSNISLLAEQVAQFDPELAVVYDDACAQQLKEKLPAANDVDIVYGEEGYCAAAAYPSVDITVTAVVGAAGLSPTLAAIEASKTVALANKETLVMAGDIVIRRAMQKGIQIRPIDSEHSAIFQCLEGQSREDVANILLTASGGPFLNLPADKFDVITVEDALDHPNWQMGRKITIDSATMMNKGLEVLEAKHLFGVSHDRISVVIHPQSVIHSMVAYHDGSVIAQLGIPDMKAAIAYALSYPQRLPLRQRLPDFSGGCDLSFQDPDLERFPCLALAYSACEVGGSMPAVLNAANEVAVHAFLDRKISFIDISSIVRQTMAGHRVSSDPTLDDIIAADGWARKCAEQLVQELRN